MFRTGRVCVAALMACAAALGSCVVRADEVVPIGSSAELVRACARVAARPGAAAGRIVLQLAPGDYHLTPQPYTDPTCGNCEDPQQPVPATLGMRLSGDSLVVRGDDPDSVRIHTHAGYGLLIEDCRNCRLESLTVTGGERDTSGRATDAAVVVRRSDVTLAGCRLSDNIGDSATVARTVVGIMGLCGREGAHITLRQCEILRNSWDGIALYRDAEADIEGCLIDGVDRGAQGPACGGRGVAIGVTWNGRARIIGNLVRRYWKGIGLFVDAEATVQENIVEEMLTWGISLWDAGRGAPYGDIAWNAVYRTGACGLSVTRGQPGGRAGSAVHHNAVVRSGQNAKYDTDDYYCYQRAVAVHARNPHVRIEANLRYDNREPQGRPGAEDLAREPFLQALEPLMRRLGRRPLLRRSSFWTAFAGDAGATDRGAASESDAPTGTVSESDAPTGTASESDAPTGTVSEPDSPTRPGWGQRLVLDLKTAVVTFAGDAAHVYSAPVRWSRGDWLKAGGLAAIGGLIYAYDQEIYDALHRNRDEALYKPLRTWGEAVEPVGHMGVMNRYYFGALAAGYLLGIGPVTELSAQIIESHFISGGVKNLAAALVGRERPRAGLGPRAYDDGTSFPSGHAINVFELAVLLADRTPVWPLQAALYGTAVAVAFQRVTDDQHWPSDSYAAAVLGTFTARAILARHAERRAAIAPVVTARGLGLAFTASW